MTISFEGYTTNASVGAATSLVLTKPAGEWSWGNTLFILVGNDDATSTDQFDPWTGWTKQFELGSPLGDCHLALFTRRADGTEGSTETVTVTSSTDIWGVYGVMTDAGDEFTSIKLGTANEETSSASHVIPAVDPDRDSITFFALAFDGADATFTIISPWTEDATIKSGTGGTNASGVFGSYDTSAGSPTTPGATTVTSSVSDGSQGIQFSFRPFTFYEKCLVVATELEVLIGPSSENWDYTVEESTLRDFTAQAQLSTRVVHPFTAEGTEIRRYVLDTLSTYLFTAGGSLSEKESNATPGQVNVATADMVARITADVEEEAPIL